MNSPEDVKPKADGGQPAPERPGQAASNAETAAKPRFRLSLIAGMAAVVLVIGFFVGTIPHWHQNKVLNTDTQQLAIATVAVVSPRQASLLADSCCRPKSDPGSKPPFTLASGFFR